MTDTAAQAADTSWWNDPNSFGRALVQSGLDIAKSQLAKPVASQTGSATDPVTAKPTVADQVKSNPWLIGGLVAAGVALLVVIVIAIRR